MTCAEVFSYALLLKGGDRAAAIFELLDTGKQEEVKTALEARKNLPLDTIRQLWQEQRQADELLIQVGT